MKVIINTPSNYGRLNGKELDVIEIAGARVSCLVYSNEFQKDVIIDFGLSEVLKFTTYSTFPVVMGLRIGKENASKEEIKFSICTLFEENQYYVLFKSKDTEIAKIKCTGDDIKQLRNFEIIDK